jgi:hypothetical protein
MSAVREHLRSVVEAVGHPEWAALSDHGERVQRLLAEMPAAVWHKVQGAVATKYRTLEDRYGRPMAVAIISAGILGTAVPLTGTSIVAAAPLIGLAELHHRLTAEGDSAAEGSIEKVRLAKTEIRQVGERWVDELVSLLKQEHEIREAS